MDEGTSLYKKYLCGDESSLNKLVALYGDSLMLFINNFINNLSVSEEIMEDVFMELIVKKHYFRGESSFKTYLFRIGRNKALNQIKKNKRYTYIEDETTIEDKKKFEDEIIKTEEQKHIHEALSKLPKDYKTVLYLIYFENMSYEEIERVMKKNNKQIKNLAYRARQSLKEILGKEGFKYEE